MAELEISDYEAKELLIIGKVSTAENPVELPDLGGRVDMPFTSIDRREEFHISFTRSSIILEKRNHHLRGRKVIGLARLDLDGPGHRNPDGEEIGPRHLHVYREGYGLKFAIEVPQDLFRNLDDPMVTLDDFFRYCSVVTPPAIKKSLFT
ncbi:DUF6978 family protein [Hoeflea alexandrii]